MRNSMNNFRSKNIFNNIIPSRKKFSKYQKKISFNLIYDLYKSNFVDNCEFILLEKQNFFLENFFNKMKYIIKADFGEDIFEKNNSLYEMTKKCENDFIYEVYKPMFNMCNNEFEKFQKNKKINNSNNNISYLTNFLSHCNFEQIALHSCGAKLISINKDNNSNKNKYIICSKCKKCYFSDCILAYCPFSQKEYYTKILNNNSITDLQPATWEEYHCKNPIINEQMSCIKCGELLYIKKNKNLFCKNCKLNVDPLTIVWICKICNKEFKSKAKLYNPLEYKEEQNAIKNALIYKIIVKPNELPCECIKKNEIKNYNFYHYDNKRCPGVIYFGKLKNDEIVVCSECKCFYKIKKFRWCCPICKKYFFSKIISLYSKYEDNIINNFVRIKNENNKNININKKEIKLNLGGTPLNKKQKLNLSINNFNCNNLIKSYIKKKPEDYYIYTSKNKDNSNAEENEFNINQNNEKRRNLSIIYKSKNNYLRKEYDLFQEMKSDIKDDNKYFTNLNFYIKNSSKKNLIQKEIKNNSDSFWDYKCLKTEKSPEPKFSRINLISSRNFIEEENSEIYSDFNKEGLNNEKKSQKINNIRNNLIQKNDITNSKIYVPKRKLDSNRTNLFTSLFDNKHDNEDKDFNGNKNTLKNNQNSNSVGIREKYKYKKLKQNIFKNINNFKTVIIGTTNDDKEKENNSIINIRTNLINNKNNEIEVNNINSNNNIRNKLYKEIRNSSQIRIDRNRYTDNNKNRKININKEINMNTIRNKYNKRYIGKKYNLNYTNINTTKNDLNKSIYQRKDNNLISKEISTTNKSNGADSFVLNNNNNGNNNNNNNNNDINQPSTGNKMESNDDINNYKNINDGKIINDDHNGNNNLKEFNIDDYKIITQLGQGTFGKIYLVQDKNNNLFSMKKIILSEELDVQSVIKEYKMCQKLNHENIVKILGIYSNKLDATTYVVYVLMEVGMTDWEKQITSYEDKKLEYSEKNLIHIIKQLSSVLSFLQKNNICHRDIKPQNILVFKNDVYKLADFGEAKQLIDIKKNLTNYSLRGTELYMSPLLFNGLRNGQIDIKHNVFKSDVYSLGLCVLFAAVTKNRPLYEIRKYIDMKDTRKYLEKIIKGKYSFKFVNLLCNMLEIHEKNRPDFIELEKIMKKWK